MAMVKHQHLTIVLHTDGPHTVALHTTQKDIITPPTYATTREAIEKQIVDDRKTEPHNGEDPRITTICAKKDPPTPQLTVGNVEIHLLQHAIPPEIGESQSREMKKRNQMPLRMQLETLIGGLPYGGHKKLFRKKH